MGQDATLLPTQMHNHDQDISLTRIHYSRRMSAEKYQLESSMTQSTKQMESMSMNVEELQWRIRNNFDLPVQV